MSAAAEHDDGITALRDLALAGRISVRGKIEDFHSVKLTEAGAQAFLAQIRERGFDIVRRQGAP
jgi:hypothetical protein